MIRLFFLFLISLPALSRGQHYFPGFVVTHAGDTVHGLLKHPFGSPYGFRFKPENSGGKEFSEKDVSSFFIEKEGLFRVIVFRKDSQRHMVRVFIDGYLSYYEVQLGVTTDSYYHILQKKDDENQCWYSSDLFSGFRNGLVKYLSDDPALCDKIRRGEYEKKEILRIVDEYNAFHAHAAGSN